MSDCFGVCHRYHIDLNHPNAIGRVAGVLNAALEREVEVSRSFVRASFVRKPPPDTTTVLAHLGAGTGVSVVSNCGRFDPSTTDDSVHTTGTLGAPRVITLSIRPRGDPGGAPTATGWGSRWSSYRRKVRPRGVISSREALV